MNGSKVYWADDRDDKIQRANFDGTQRETIGSVWGRDLALDVGQGKMYVAGGIRIYRTGLGGSPVETFLTLTASALSITLDLSGGKIYWGGHDGIQRANLDGSQLETIVKVELGGIALDLDVGGGKIYWAGNGRIQRANLDGSQPAVLFTNTRTAGLAVDVGGGKIYWTDDWDDIIQRANLDGSQRETIVPGGDDPSDIALGP